MYREIEKKDWSPVCSNAINRVREFAFPKETSHLSYVHVLDLAKDGHIKPHIDSVRVKLPKRMVVAQFSTFEIKI